MIVHRETFLGWIADGLGGGHSGCGTNSMIGLNPIENYENRPTLSLGGLLDLIMALWRNGTYFRRLCPILRDTETGCLEVLVGVQGDV